MFPTQRIATLIAHPDNPCLTQQLADSARDAVNAKAVYFLADGIACDIPLPQDIKIAREHILLALGDAPIDVVVQDADTRRKKVLLADMDSTLIEQECIDELAAEAGVGEHVADITARAMRGELEFDSALRERVGLLKGLPVSIIDKVLSDRITIMSGAAQLVATMKKSGAYCALASGGFTQFTGKIAKTLDFDEHRANVLGIDGNTLSGTVVPPILGQQAKVDALNDIITKHGLEADDVIAVGDGANDLAMLSRAGSGVALHAKPIVANQAKMRVDHADLTALLYIQGYRKADFANA